MNVERIREVLIINVSRIGDTLLGTPAIRAIAAAYPEARITCLGHPKRAGILENLPFVHRVGAIDKRRAVLRGRFGRPRYDLAFVWNYDRALVAYALRVAYRVVAYRQNAPALDRRLQPAVDPPPFQSRHAVRMQLSLPEAVGITAAGLRLAYRVTETEAREARDTLSRLLPHGGHLLIGLQVASFPTKAFRDWPLDNFMKLCARILERWPRAYFLIFGGPLERERTEALRQRFAGNAASFAGKLSLRQTAALMGELNLYIGVDTGPTHIMGSFDIPMVVLYHSHSPSRLLAPIDHPCLYAIDHPLAEREEGARASMDAISVDTAWELVCRALAEHPLPPWTHDMR